MRRYWVLVLAVLTLLGALAPPALAQAPAPKVTITGLIDTVTSARHNADDAAYAGSTEDAWASRNRGVFTITGAVGKAKGVLALELDLGWGQPSANESVNSNNGQTITSKTSGFGSTQGAFQQGSMDLGLDVGGVIEIKNLYVEFPVPNVPWPTVMALGGQPARVTYKPAVLLTTDVPGVWLSSTINPWFKFNFTFVQIEEDQTGPFVTATFKRGEDLAIFVHPDITPWKGLDIRPIYSYVFITGITDAFIRCRVQCAGQPGQGAGASENPFTGAVTLATTPGAFGFGTDGAGTTFNSDMTFNEHRHYFGFDARWTQGPFYLDPTFLVMLSQFDVARAPGAAAGNRVQTGKDEGSISAMLVDIRGGWRVGPLNLQGMVMFASGSSARDNMFLDSHAYRPINVDIAYGAGWTEILALGSVDYFFATGHGMGENIGLGRYGRVQVGARGAYALTPEITTELKWASAWTHKSVDTDALAASTRAASYGTQPCLSVPANGVCDGDESYIGTEISLGLTYRFAPGLTFDVVGAWLFTGSAADTTVTRNAVNVKDGAKDAQILAARVRYTF